MPLYFLMLVLPIAQLMYAQNFQLEPSANTNWRPASQAPSFRHTVLDPNGDFVFEWSVGKNPSDPFRIRISGRSRGWLAVGFSPNGAMKNSDIVLLWFDQNGNPQISDRHGPMDETNGYPPSDSQQNYELVKAQNNGTFMTFELVRPMDTCDSNDYAVSSGTVQVIYAANDVPPVSADNFQKHTIRGGKAVRLLDPPAAIPKQYSAFVDISAGGVRVPQNRDTLYFCKAYSTKKFPQPMEMIGYDMLVQPGNEKHVHHILWYGCTGNNTKALLNVEGDCFVEAVNISNQCNDYLGGWAVGGQPFTLPDNMGKQYFGELYDVIGAQWHYDNSEGDSGVKDNSSMRVYLTDQPRPVKVGGFAMGAVTKSTTIIIPPNQTSFKTQYVCATNCTKNIPEPINIISGLLHAHLAGVSLRVRQIRNGVELPNPLSDQNYDFNYQTPIIRFDNPVQILPGDYLVLECDYDTTGRINVTLGGIGTHEEMCLAFMDFYPARNESVFGCVSAFPEEPIIKLLGGSNFTDVNDPESDRSTLLYNGRNVTYKNWINQLPWTANENQLANKLQNYMLSAPQYQICMIPLPDGASSNSSEVTQYDRLTSFMTTVPNFRSYIPVDTHCSSRA